MDTVGGKWWGTGEKELGNKNNIDNNHIIIIFIIIKTK